MCIGFECATTLGSILTRNICYNSLVCPLVQVRCYTIRNNTAYFRSEQYAGNQFLSFVTHVPVPLFVVFRMYKAGWYIY